jgi:hypothetical protein
MEIGYVIITRHKESLTRWYSCASEVFAKRSDALAKAREFADNNPFFDYSVNRIMSND